MAPMFTTPVSPQKRPLSSAADIDAHPLKKRRQFYHRHHALQLKQQSLPGTEPALFGQVPPPDHKEETGSDCGQTLAGRSQIDGFLEHSIVSICEDVVARDGIANAAIETWALETFKGCVEEYVRNLCKYIRRPMVAARRTAPIVTDFESAFQAAQVPTPEDQLLRKSSAKPPPQLSLLPPAPDAFSAHELPESILRPDTSPEEEKRSRCVPSTFPAFPSQHTFKATPVPPPPERDQRRTRELATEEGRLGEQALRKLALAARGEGKLEGLTYADHASVKGDRGTRPRRMETMEEVFEETMKELSKDQKGGGSGEATLDANFELAPIVNSERKFWMPDTGVRRPSRVEPSTSASRAGGSHRILAESGRSRQRPAHTATRHAEKDSVDENP